MSYNTNDIMGYAQDPIVFSNEQGGNELYEKVKEVMVYGINENGLPATMFEDTIKSGGMFGTKCPLLMIRHSDSSCRFFMIGIFVYGNQVMFALFGESAENTKYNRKQYYQENGNFIKAALIKPDEFKLQSELQWREDILNVFNDSKNFSFLSSFIPSYIFCNISFFSFNVNSKGSLSSL